MFCVCYDVVVLLFPVVAVLFFVLMLLLVYMMLLLVLSGVVCVPGIVSSLSIAVVCFLCCSDVVLCFWCCLFLSGVACCDYDVACLCF